MNTCKKGYIATENIANNNFIMRADSSADLDGRILDLTSWRMSVTTSEDLVCGLSWIFCRCLPVSFCLSPFLISLRYLLPARLGRDV